MSTALQSIRALVTRLRSLGQDLQAGLPPNAAEQVWDVADALSPLLDTLEQEKADQRVIGHGEGQAHALADVNSGLVDDLIAERLARGFVAGGGALPPWVVEGCSCWDAECGVHGQEVVPHVASVPLCCHVTHDPEERCPLACTVPESHAASLPPAEPPQEQP